MQVLTLTFQIKISQEGEALQNIMVEDLWPGLDDFSMVLDSVESLMAEDAEALGDEATGSQHRMDAIAERARLAEEREARRQAKLEAQRSQDAVKPAQEVETSSSESGFEEHDWLVE